MPSRTVIVAHLIIGRKPELYLSEALEAIAGVCTHAVVVDTSGGSNTVNTAAIAASRLAREARLTWVLTDFHDFAAARNECLDATPGAFREGWALVVDADEVHTPALEAVARLLPRLPHSVDAVDGYLRHFVGSFGWWTDLNRTRLFFRMSGRRRWIGAVHERLSPPLRRIALPYVWFHYGHVVTPREEAEKGILYRSLGQDGPAATSEQALMATPASVWANLLRRALPYRGEHPPVMVDRIRLMSAERCQLFHEVDDLARRQTWRDRLKNSLRDLNARRLLAWRAWQGHLLWGWGVRTQAGEDCAGPQETWSY
jgi:hypothetical protein